MYIGSSDVDGLGLWRGCDFLTCVDLWIQDAAAVLLHDSCSSSPLSYIAVNSAILFSISGTSLSLSSRSSRSLRNNKSPARQGRRGRRKTYSSNSNRRSASSLVNM